jgi:hypothetical protein
VGPALHEQPEQRAEEGEHGAPLVDYIKAAQRRGQIRVDLDADWLFQALVALITQAASHARTDPGARSTMLRITVCSILAPPSRGRPGT